MVASGIFRVLAIPSIRDADGLLRPSALLVRSLLLTGAILAVTASLLRLVEGRSLLFGFMHADNPGANLAGLGNTAANGVLLAWLVMRTGSLWIACAYHGGWNITGAMIFGMRLSGLDHAGGLLLTRLTGPDWLTGGSYGFEGSVLVGLIEFAVLSLAVAAAPHLPGQPDVLPFFGVRRRSSESGESRPQERRGHLS